MFIFHLLSLILPFSNMNFGFLHKVEYLHPLPQVVFQNPHSKCSRGVKLKPASFHLCLKAD